MKKLTNYFIPIFVASLMLLLGACDKRDSAVFGPDLGIPSNNFEMTSGFAVSNTNIDFTTDSLVFNAEFNENVTWFVTLTGMTSGAVMQITGFSSLIDINNAVWKGGHLGIQFFQAGETVTATLSFFGSQISFSETLTIQSGGVFSGILLNDFDGGGILVPENGPQTWFGDYFDPNPTEEEFIARGTSQINNPIQGGYRLLEGQDGLGSADWWVGGFGHNVSSNFGILSTDAEEVYINFYARGRVGDTKINLSLLEADGDKYSFAIVPVIGKWDLYSQKLSSCIFNENTEGGDFIKDPSTISKMDCQLVTNVTNGQHVGFDIDFIIITEGGPFDPSK